MERETQDITAIIELGAVTTETRGPVGPTEDIQLGQFEAGLNDD